MKTLEAIKITGDVTLTIVEDVETSEIDQIVSAVRHMTMIAPYEGKIEITYPNFLPLGIDDNWQPMLADGETDIESVDRKIQLSKEIWKPRDNDGYWMPVFSSLTRAQYVIGHEWGHACDVRDNSPMAYKLRIFAMFASRNAGALFQSLSQYALLGGEMEAHAEAFVEWYLSNGETTNTAAKWYAKEYDWEIGKTFSLS